MCHSKNTEKPCGRKNTPNFFSTFLGTKSEIIYGLAPTGSPLKSCLFLPVTLDVFVVSQPTTRNPNTSSHLHLTHAPPRRVIIIIMVVRMVMPVPLKRLPEFLPSQCISGCCSGQQQQRGKGKFFHQSSLARAAKQSKSGPSSALFNSSILAPNPLGVGSGCDTLAGAIMSGELKTSSSCSSRVRT